MTYPWALLPRSILDQLRRNVLRGKTRRLIEGPPPARYFPYVVHDVPDPEPVNPVPLRLV